MEEFVDIRVSKVISEPFVRISPGDGVYLLSICARPGRCIAEVECHTDFQFLVTYRTNRITKVVLLIR